MLMYVGPNAMIHVFQPMHVYSKLSQFKRKKNVTIEKAMFSESTRKMSIELNEFSLRFVHSIIQILGA